jgi:chemotaxis protein MotA
MEIVIEGILSIQAGANPRLVEQKLQSLIPQDMQKPAEKDVA